MDLGRQHINNGQIVKARAAFSHGLNSAQKKLYTRKPDISNPVEIGLGEYQKKPIYPTNK